MLAGTSGVRLDAFSSGQRLRSAWAIAGLVLGLSACAVRPPRPAPTLAIAPDPRDIDVSLFLIGDAGDPHEGEGALQALRDALARLPRGRIALVAFLGDNVYEKGLPKPASRGSADALRRLQAQREVLKNGPTRGLFVPGNHDWERSGKGGWAAICRADTTLQSLRVADHIEASLQPTKGCPGPWHEDVGTRLRIVVLDTQWWLHPGPKPPDPASPVECGSIACAESTPSAVVSAVKDLLTNTGNRHAVVLAHHPLATAGPHGRKNGDQDLKNAAYDRLISSMKEAFATAPPLLYAAGHEHSLQFLQPAGLPSIVVSGAGSRSKGSDVRPRPDQGVRFHSAAPGFMRLDVLSDGRAYLEVITACCGSPEAAYSTWLREKPVFLSAAGS